MEVDTTTTTTTTATATTTTTTKATFDQSRFKIKDGDHVILDINDGEKYSVIQVRKPYKTKIGKQQIDISSIIGESFYSLFQVSGTGLKKVTQKELEDAMNSLTELNKSEDANNSNLDQNHTAQKLSQQDIIDMKTKGTDSDVIIKTLIENSASFQSKTAYSQIKYLKKKLKKYKTIVKVVRPTLKSLTQANYSKDPRKICNLRFDTFGQLLTLANIRSGQSVLTVETTMGLVTGSIAERMGSQGTILNAYIGKGPSLSIVNSFGFPQETLNTIYPFNLNVLDKLNSGQDVSTITPVQVQFTKLKEEKDKNNSETTATTTTTTTTAVVESIKTNNNRNDTSTENIVRMVKEGVWSLVIVTHYSPLNILLACLPHLNNSGNFVVFCQYSQPLVECHQFLHENFLAVNLQITEIWMREQQVLPKRTHPMMGMDGASGYLLSGIKATKPKSNVVKSESTAAAAILVESEPTTDNMDTAEESALKKRKREDQVESSSTPVSSTSSTQ
ncbi:hypothetical protein CYY_001026 [Polysphondylium violaceum]|uniref:tRNA (adenine(58)-N(1))-methyltransferase non-catalytic subunit TRM6 n=1 Tax=Polysphondylium violaceum TaxID=133409 RepID=A0A8J4VAY6_9MYCE|nr:hypothetical protein CYY_001026 [Polysphondylium violaceum]